MSVEMGFAWRMYLLQSGQYRHYPEVGGYRTRRREFDTDEGGRITREVTIAAGAEFTVWSYAAGTLRISGLVLELLDDAGELDLAIKADTEAANGDATGAAVTWQKTSLRWHTPFILNTRRTLTNTSAANHAGGAFGVSGEVVGAIYEVRVKNPGTDAVRLGIVLYSADPES